jgi:guanylate kinase
LNSDKENVAASTPLMIVVSAPSGAGKTTLCNKLLAEFPDFTYSVSCTTRQPRGEEADGVAYSFLTKEQFLELVKQGKFLEHAEVHGNYYGTLGKTVIDSMAAGKSLVLDIDVEGASQIRNLMADMPDDDILKKGFLDIFITIPSVSVLRHRLLKRGEDTVEVIEKRLKNAVAEMARANEFSHTLVNDQLEDAYAELRAIVLNKAAGIGAV